MFILIQWSSEFRRKTFLLFFVHFSDQLSTDIVFLVDQWSSWLNWNSIVHVIDVSMLISFLNIQLILFCHVMSIHWIFKLIHLMHFHLFAIEWEQKEVRKFHCQLSSFYLYMVTIRLSVPLIFIWITLDISLETLSLFLNLFFLKFSLCCHFILFSMFQLGLFLSNNLKHLKPFVVSYCDNLNRFILISFKLHFSSV